MRWAGLTLSLLVLAVRSWMMELLQAQRQLAQGNELAIVFHAEEVGYELGFVAKVDF